MFSQPSFRKYSRKNHHCHSSGPKLLAPADVYGAFMDSVFICMSSGAQKCLDADIKWIFVEAVEQYAQKCKSVFCIGSGIGGKFVNTAMK
jgi:hypothetical protein